MVVATTRQIDFTAQYNAGNAIDDRHLESEFDNILDTLDELLVTVGSTPTSIGKGNTRVYVDSVAGIAPIVYVGDQDGDAIDIVSGLRTEVVNLSGTVSSLIPVGTIISVAYETADDGFLKCNGAEYDKTVYTSLYAKIGTNFGETDGEGGEGTSHFCTPDFRGMFLRGWSDDDTSNDPDRATRTANNVGGNTGNNVGSEQANQNKLHTHSVPYATQNLGYIGGEAMGTGLTGVSSKTSGESGGNQSNPENVYVNFLIKY